MGDLITAIGLVFVIEGLIYALAPGVMKRMAAMASGMEESQLRIAGLAAAAFGVVVVWLIRG